CCLPVLEFKNSNKPNDVMWGFNALAVGWSGIFAGVVAWYANFFWGLGLMFGFLRKPIFGAVAGVIAIGLGLMTFTYIGQELPADEGNVTRTAIIRILPGCYVWLASLVVLLIAVLLQKPKPTLPTP